MWGQHVFSITQCFSTAKKWSFLITYTTEPLRISIVQIILSIDKYIWYQCILNILGKIDSGVDLIQFLCFEFEFYNDHISISIIQSLTFVRSIGSLNWQVHYSYFWKANTIKIPASMINVFHDKDINAMQ